MRSLLLVLVVAISATACVSDVRAEEKPIPLEKLPKAVSDAVKKMFPKAKMIKASLEKEKDGEVEYEVTLKDNGKTIEVTVEKDGEIEELEMEVALRDLPKAVSETLRKKYPEGKPQSAEAVYELEDGTKELEYYEVQLKTAGGKKVEVKIKANGKLVKGDEDEDDDDSDGKEDRR